MNGKPISQMLNEALNNSSTGSNNSSPNVLSPSPFLFSSTSSSKQLIPKIAPKPQFQQFLALKQQQQQQIQLQLQLQQQQQQQQQFNNVKSSSNVNLIPPTTTTTPTSTTTNTVTSPISSISDSTKLNELKIKEQCENLLKGCNKVNIEIKNQIFNFLMGIDSNQNEKKIKEKKIRLLLHEEPNQHQIIFQMDLENNSWKKLMKKIKP